ncbi:uncharacterized protein LOC113790989 isoform X2 [Dermatophagoides pteronyssinus]|uniref:uncharacterized protein LOC113790989 isoform X2 n=1 Tax=Dermatophagoides pteronyssinus TaxID=6956 RepID=UPI003F66F266
MNEEFLWIKKFCRSADDFGVDTTTITEDDDGDNDDINNGGIDNAGLDFSQLEEYINQVDNDHQHQLEQQQNDDTTNLYYQDEQQQQNSILITSSPDVVELKSSSPLSSKSANLQQQYHLQSYETITNSNHQSVVSCLPDSPPDSGSEPPFSPKSTTNNNITVIAEQQQQQQSDNMEENMKHFINNDYSQHNNHHHHLNHHNHHLNHQNHHNVKIETTSLNHHHHHHIPQSHHPPPHPQHSIHHPQPLPQHHEQILQSTTNHHQHHTLQQQQHPQPPSAAAAIIHQPTTATTNTQLSILESHHQMVTLGVAAAAAAAAAGSNIVPSSLTCPLTVNSVSMIHHNLSSVTTGHHHHQHQQQQQQQSSMIHQTNYHQQPNNNNIYANSQTSAPSMMIEPNNSYHLSRLTITTPPDCQHYTTLTNTVNQSQSQTQQPIQHSTPPPPPPQSNLIVPITGGTVGQNSGGGVGVNGGKKRKISETKSNGGSTTTTNIYIKQEPNNGLSPDSGHQQQHGLNGIINDNSSNSNNNNNVHSTQQCDDDFLGDYGPDSQMYSSDSFYQCIRFTSFNTNLSCPLYDVNFKEIPTINYRVDADKGFNFSNADDAFVCQKKNHFQVTVHIQIVANPFYVKTLSTEIFQKIDNFYLHFYGVKVESPTQTIKVEQSQSDRSKKAFHPVRIELSCDQVTKMTVGRLHFSETTSNNMRKKGKPNPDQRYFYLVVSLCAHVGDQIHQIAAQASERIIVRASNPGQFENDVELVWQKGPIPETIFHTGRVGINTDRPDESLVVFGNAKVTGSIMQPSDKRAKTNIEEVDTREQLKNVSNMRIVRYQFKPSFAKEVGIDQNELNGTGILAQEVQQILPEAVKETGDIILSDGEMIENFLVVNKDRIFMENLGAVKELCKVTDNLETRIDELERMNTKLSKFNRFDSIKSNASSSTITCVSSNYRNNNNNNNNNKTMRKNSCHRRSSSSSHHHKSYCSNSSQHSMPINQGCNNRFFQTLIMILIFIMAFCLASIATLYILEYHRRHHSNIINHHSSTSLSSSSSLSSDHHHYHTQSSSFDLPPYSNVNNNNQQQQQSPSNPNSFVETINKSNRLNKDRTHPTHHPQPTAIPVLKPQVLGAPNGCYDYTSTTLCPVHCCTDENFNVYHLNSNIEPSNTNNLKDPNKSHFIIDHKFDLAEESTSTVINETLSANDTMTNNASMIAINSSNSLSNQSKFNPNESNSSNINKKKRTDKGIRSFTNDNDDDDDNKNIDGNGKYSHSSSIQDIHSLNDFHDSKFHRRRRKRRETGKSSTQNNMYNTYPKKDLTRMVEMIKLLELNATIDYSYCTKLHCTQGFGNRFHYTIPISKYMELEYVTLQFELNQEMKVDHCEMKEKPVTCSSGYYGMENIPQSYKKTADHILLPESSPHWRLPIGIYQRSSYIFRILSRDIIADSPCNLSESQAGSSFVEYKFEFIRKCDK